MRAWAELVKDADWQVAIALASGICLIVQHFEKFLVPTWVIPGLVAICILFAILSALSILSAWLRERG